MGATRALIHGLLLVSRRSQAVKFIIIVCPVDSILAWNLLTTSYCYDNCTFKEKYNELQDTS